MSAAAALTTLICRAPHPARHRKARFADGFHGRFIQKLPFRMVPTGRDFGPEEWEHIDYAAGCVGVQCPAKDCRRISEYRILPPRER